MKKKIKIRINETVYEMCPYCEEEVELKAVPKKMQICPKCGMMIRACSMCDMDTVDCNKCGVENE